MNFREKIEHIADMLEKYPTQDEWTTAVAQFPNLTPEAIEVVLKKVRELKKPKRLTVLELIADRSKVATDAANRYKAACLDYNEASKIDMKSYRQGQAIAFNEAHDIMKAELERLRNMWQNGQLTYDSFTGV